jgi:inhibitor of KinA
MGIANIKNSHKTMKSDAFSSVKFYPLGDAALVLQFGNSISRHIHAKVSAFASHLEKFPFEGMIEYVPAFTTITIYYNTWILSEDGSLDPYQKVVSIIQHMMSQVKEKEKHISRIIEIPVCYGGEFGPDLAFVAKHTQLDKEEVIAIHAGGEYLVYMIGFAPGFPYLGGMNKKIAAPRREVPRPKIPAGSVGIAGKQTGIYSIETPGGWQLIGRTPLLLFNPTRNPPAMIRAGEIIRFVPISAQEYRKRKEQENEY